MQQSATLFLTGATGARPSFYSHMSAPGFIMASGNTGEHLDFAADTTCTWLSSDGGLTWKDVADHTAIYEFGDHGSIVLLARHEVSALTNVEQLLCTACLGDQRDLAVTRTQSSPQPSASGLQLHGSMRGWPNRLAHPFSRFCSRPGWLE